MKTGLRFGRLAAVVFTVAGVLTGSAHGQAAVLTAQPLVDIRELGMELEIHVGRSHVVRLPLSTSRVAVADPAIIDVQMIEPNQILLFGMGLGETDLHVWNDDGTIYSTLIKVRLNLERFDEELRVLFPNSRLKTERAGDVYVVSGMLRDAPQMETLQKYLALREAKFMNSTTLAGAQQVQIKVRVAEVNRTAIRNMTLNAFKVDSSWFAASQLGSSGGPLTSMPLGIPENALVERGLPFAFLNDLGPSPLVTLLAGFPTRDLQMFLEALAEKQYVQILAEPTLVALSGEEASFLAGGEYPIPVAREVGVASGITIEYKEFGVRLRIRPTVLGEGNIRLHVAPEVSELSSAGAIEISGFRVPSVLTRRSETTVEMKSGQTFAMAGLLTSNTNARKSQVPGLGNLPVLGPMFRSISYTSGDSELVILVTAELAEPLSTEDHLVPGDLQIKPNDWELFLGGKLHGSLKHVRDGDGVQLDLDNLRGLRGPGAWARYYP
jgi:pilus assembly protein CpaC